MVQIIRFILVVFFIILPLPVKADLKAFFSPSLNCENNIVKHIDKAEKSIDVAVYSINNKDIVKALKRAHDRGVKIRILTDKLQAGKRTSKVIELHDYGIKIRVNSKHKIEHNKFAIFDFNDVLTGSYNWTEPASTKNSENCLFFNRNKKTLREYHDRFNYLWQMNTRKSSEKWFKRKK